MRQEQKRHDGDMGKRLWKYNAQATIIIIDLSVYSFVVFLQRDGNVVQSPYKLPFPGKEVVEDTTLLRRLNVKLSAAQTVQEAEQTFRVLVKDAQQH